MPQPHDDFETSAVMFEQPAKKDIDHALSMLMHEARRQVADEKNRITSEAAKHGTLRSNFAPGVQLGSGTGKPLLGADRAAMRRRESHRLQWSRCFAVHAQLVANCGPEHLRGELL